MQTMRKPLAFLSALLAALLLAGCTAGAASGSASPAAPTPAGEGGGDGGEGRLSIVTTIFPHYDFARAVAGDLADITMLIRPGSETHSFDPSPADIIAIQNADLFVFTGGANDEWAESILASMEDGKRVLRMLDVVQAVEEELVEGMQPEADDGHEHEDEDTPHLDEHVWTSPVNAMKMVDAVAAALSETSPANAAAFAANAAAYNGALQQLDTDIRALVANAGRKLLVFGDRFPFRYFTDEYGLEYRAAFPGCSTEAEASAGTVAGLIDVVRQQEIPCVYIIELSSGNIARVISEETGAEVLQLNSCHNLTKEQFEAGETYVSLMRGNLVNLERGLA